MILHKLLNASMCRYNAIATTAKVHLEVVTGDFAIAKIELETEAEVPGIDHATFDRMAQEGKQGCPVSKVFAAEITLQSTRLNK